MDFTKKLFLSFIIVVLVLVIISFGVMRIEDNIKKNIKKNKDKLPVNAVETAIDTPKNYFNKNIYSKMDIYNELVNVVDDFLFLLREKDYEAAYAKMNPDYMNFKGISNLDEFKELISVYGYDNASFNIIEYSKTDLYTNDSLYLCKVITFTANMGDEYESPEEYYLNKKENYDTFVINLQEDNYRLAFEGFISKETLQNNEKIVNNLLTVIPISKYSFDNMTVFEIMFKNISDTELNPSDMIMSIVAEDLSSDFYWADELPNTKDYELNPGEALNYYISVKHGVFPIVDIVINFKDNYKLFLKNF